MRENCNKKKHKVNGMQIQNYNIIDNNIYGLENFGQKG